MSKVAAIRSVNSLLEAKKSSIGSPKAMFRSVLEEKLGVSSEADGGSYSSTVSNGNGAAYSELLNNGGTTSLTDSNSISGWQQLVNSNKYSKFLEGLMQSSGNTTAKTDYDAYIKQASLEHGVPENLIKAVIFCESSFNPNAVSKSGAIGLMQLMPATAKGLGVSNPYDPQQNINGGTKYLSSLIKNFDGDLILAMSGYNMGGTKVKNYGITPNTSNPNDYNVIPSGVLSYAKKVVSKMAEYGGGIKQ